MKEKDNRPVYALQPVLGAQNPYFAYKPSARPPGASSSWLTYDPAPGSDSNLTWDKQTDPVFFNDQPIEVVGADNTLICGTSVFLIKTSGTPNVELVGRDEEPISTEQAERLQSQFNPNDLATIKIRLSSTERWRDYEPKLLEDIKSEVSACWGLTHPQTDDRRFLKSYYPVSAPNATREADFYTKYGKRAEELYLVSPDEILRRDDEDAPWGIVFPRLRPLTSPTFVEIAAIGYGMVTLLKRLAADELINFDLDHSMLCCNDHGRLVIVDFDNLFPVPSFPFTGTQIQALARIVETGQLPTKNSLLPPEASDFRKAATEGDRQRELAQLCQTFNTYMLGAVLLQLLNLAELAPDNHLIFPKNSLLERAAEQKADPESARQLEVLLREMVQQASDQRPKIEGVADRLSDIARAFAQHSEDHKELISKLVPTLLPRT